MTTKQLNVRLPVELHRALERHKELTGEDKSEVIRRGIELVLHAQPTTPAIDPEPIDELAGDLNTLREQKRENAADVLERVRSLISQRS